MSREWVTDLVGQLLDVDERTLAGSTVLADCGGWDSVNQMRVLVRLEARLGTTVDFDRFMSVVTLDDLLAVVTQGESEMIGRAS